jgi:DNA-binding LacI/PurR family transcriptional regulator
MRSKVQLAIDELGYRPNVTARRLATGRTGMLALAVPDIALPYFAELAKTVIAAAAERGYRVLIEQTWGSLDEERALMQASEAGLVDGVLFQPSVMNAVELAQHRGDLPMVLLGEGPAPLTLDRVRIDNVAAASVVTQHLASLGRRRIAFLGHEAGSPSETSRQRLLGYQQGLERAGLPLDAALLIPAPAISAVQSADALGAALDAGLEVDAVFCREDLAALGALRALRKHGLRVPEDVAVAGWDDIALAAFTEPTLTTVRPDTAGLADRGLDMLEERIAGFDGLGRHELVEFSLVLRDSAPARSELPRFSEFSAL